jgi:hypothetical protein
VPFLVYKTSGSAKLGHVRPVTKLTRKRAPNFNLPSFGLLPPTCRNWFLDIRALVLCLIVRHCLSILVNYRQLLFIIYSLSTHYNQCHKFSWLPMATVVQTTTELSSNLHSDLTKIKGSHLSDSLSVDAQISIGRSTTSTPIVGAKRKMSFSAGSFSAPNGIQSGINYSALSNAPRTQQSFTQKDASASIYTVGIIIPL